MKMSIMSLVRSRFVNIRSTVLLKSGLLASPYLKSNVPFDSQFGQAFYIPYREYTRWQRVQVRKRKRERERIKEKNQKICILRFNETDILSGLQSFLFVSHIKWVWVSKDWRRVSGIFTSNWQEQKKKSKRKVVRKIFYD